MKKINVVRGTKTVVLVLLLILDIFLNSVFSMETKNIFYQQSVPSLAPMLEKVLPSVISIKTNGHNNLHEFRLPKQLKPFFGEDSPFCQKNSPFKNSPFCHFLPDDHGKLGETFHVVGSGVIIDAEKGYAVTNNHVIARADKINVKLHDGRQYEAKIIGKDPYSDLALIQLKSAKALQAIKIANSDQLRVGDYAMAIGNPYGIGETVTSGIISALSRSGLHIEHYENFIQTDAAINRGNSGGALINVQGELIGINTAILAPDGGNIGIGFAIPGNIVKNIISQIVNFGQVKRGFLGVLGMDLNSNLSEIMKIDTQNGTFVHRVVPHSSADQAGIKAGDIILSLNDKLIPSFSALQAEVGSLSVNTKIKLVIFRKNKIINIIVTLKNAPVHKVKKEEIYFGLDGIKLKDISINNKNYIKVMQVQSHTQASNLGFKKNDVILTINQIDVTTTKELQTILNKKPNVLLFSIKRGYEIIYLVSGQ